MFCDLVVGLLRGNLFERVSPQQSDVVGGEVARGRRCGGLGPVQSADLHFDVSNCARVCCWEGGPCLPQSPPRSPSVAVFVVGTGLGLGPAAPTRPHPHLGRPRLCFPLGPLPRRCSGFSRCFYDYIVCVGGSDVGVARERAVPGRSFINVTHIMILSAASY